MKITIFAIVVIFFAVQAAEGQLSDDGLDTITLECIPIAKKTLSAIEINVNNQLEEFIGNIKIKVTLHNDLVLHQSLSLFLDMPGSTRFFWIFDQESFTKNHHLTVKITDATNQIIRKCLITRFIINPLSLELIIDE